MLTVQLKEENNVIRRKRRAKALLIGPITCLLISPMM